MDQLFNNVLVNTTSELTLFTIILTLALAVVSGLVIAGTYYITQDEDCYQRSMAVTLLMLPAILAVIILFVGSNIARAFSLAGTLSIIRFRSAPGDPKDIGFIFFDIAAGLACGVGLYGYGIVFVLFLCLVLIACEKTHLFKKKTVRKILKITVPEDLNYQGVFEEVLKKYTKGYKLTKVRTTDLGSLFEVCYNVSMEEGQDEQEFLNELRCRNGNLNIVLSVAPQVVK